MRFGRLYLTESKSKLDREGGLNLVDLVGIEPTTSSMPWKRAPSCATGPRLGKRQFGIEGSTRIIFAHITRIVNAS